MVEAIKAVAESGVELSVEERNILSVAFKNIIGSRRASWRILNSIEQREETRGKHRKRVELPRNSRKQVESELSKICDEVIGLLDNHLLTTSSSDESKVFYLKMKSDYYRYQAEFSIDSMRKSVAEKNNLAYEEALKAGDKLAATHPIRLGLALNYSVFFYKIMNSSGKACKLAKTVFDGAIADIENYLSCRDTMRIALVEFANGRPGCNCPMDVADELQPVVIILVVVTIDLMLNKDILVCDGFLSNQNRNILLYFFNYFNILFSFLIIIK